MTKNYSEKLKIIKPYINFKIDGRKKLTPYQKKKINSVYSTLKPFLFKVKTNRKTGISEEVLRSDIQIYRPRNKKNLKKVINNLPENERPANIKGLKAIPIIASGKVRIKVVHGRVKLQRNGINNTFFNLDPLDLALDSKKTIKDAVKHTNLALYARCGFCFYGNPIADSMTPKSAKSHKQKVQKLIEIYEIIVMTYEPEGVNGIFAMPSHVA